ncbi:hypothetical protein ACPDHD_16395 [Myroides odoratimimus]|uniref:hypothetical protein n=1 Tax=Myroides odoratimimus TaxID=76832 RepID=UPI003D2ED970
MEKILDYRVFKLFVFFTILGIVLGAQFSIYNYAYILITFLVIYYKSFTWIYKIIGRIIIIFFLFIFVMFFTTESILYFFLELCVFLSILGIVYIAKNTRVNSKIFSSFYRFSIYYILAYFMAYFFLSSYLVDAEEGRYAGLLGSTNFSSSFICILLMYMNEFAKRIRLKNYRQTLVICFLIWGLLLSITKSRTLLFALPYWLLQFYYFFNLDKNKIRLILFIPLCITIVIIIVMALNFEELFINMRLTNDGSFLTREAIYSSIFDKIKRAYYILPNGFNDAYVFVQSYTNVKGFAVHNDFLKYWNDLGVVFFIYLFILYGILKSALKDLTFLCIIFFILSLALHNILFSVVIWCPIYFLFKIVFNKDYE